MKARVYR